MKSGILFLLAFFLLAAIGCGGTGSVKGTWEMVYPESTDTAENKNTKVVSDSHFAFGSYSGRGGTFAGGGHYTLADSTYTEFIQYHTLGFLVGKRLEFNCVLEGDKWYHFGTFDIEGRRFKVNEIWKKVGD
jgi:hypothetical protein